MNPPAINIFHVKPANILNNKCPAVKLAANRTPKVKALAAYDTNSIITKKGAKANGLPEGINIDNQSDLKFTILNHVQANQILKLKPNVTMI